MQQPIIRIKKLQAEVNLPRYMTGFSAGLDVQAYLQAPLSLLPGMRVMVPTGLAVAIPAGYEIQVRPRSGLALKHGISLVNSPGTIDADYRGEICIILINHGQETYNLEPGERVAQLVVAPVCQAALIEVDELPDSERGSGGFGHTGV